MLLAPPPPVAISHHQAVAEAGFTLYQPADARALVVIVPGLAEDPATKEPLSRALAENGFAVIVMDGLPAFIADAGVQYMAGNPPRDLGLAQEAVMQAVREALYFTQVEPVATVGFGDAASAGYAAAATAPGRHHMIAAVLVEPTRDLFLERMPADRGKVWGSIVADPGPQALVLEGRDERLARDILEGPLAYTRRVLARSSREDDAIVDFLLFARDHAPSEDWPAPAGVEVISHEPPTVPSWLLPKPPPRPKRWCEDLAFAGGVSLPSSPSRVDSAFEARWDWMRVSSSPRVPPMGFHLMALGLPPNGAEAGGGLDVDLPPSKRPGSLFQEVRYASTGVGILAGDHRQDLDLSLFVGIKGYVPGDRSPVSFFFADGLRLEARQNLRAPSDRALMVTLQIDVPSLVALVVVPRLARIK